MLNTRIFLSKQYSFQSLQEKLKKIPWNVKRKSSTKTKYYMHVLLQIYIGNIYEIYCFTNRKFSHQELCKNSSVFWIFQICSCFVQIWEANWIGNTKAYSYFFQKFSKTQFYTLLDEYFLQFLMKIMKILNQSNDSGKFS